ncbi:MAG: hypothetical protein ACRDFS_11355 [Chloroflexota bacterium]
MRWNSLQFQDHLRHFEADYRADNAWFAWRGWDETVWAAWLLYHNASGNALRMLVLGSAKIRRNRDLVGNFGVTSGGGVSEEKDVKLIADRECIRAALRIPGVRGLADSPKVLGIGSILNDKNWTPLLNDSFILGGVHGNNEFFFAEDGFENYRQYLITQGGFVGAPPATTSRGRWLGFFNAHPDLFWDAKARVPRILAREMIGLMTFGYQPKFSDVQLEFLPGRRLQSADFAAYHEAVNTSGIVRKDQGQVLGTLSNFLFGGSDALHGVGSVSRGPSIKLRGALPPSSSGND